MKKLFKEALTFFVYGMFAAVVYLYLKFLT